MVISESLLHNIFNIWPKQIKQQNYKWFWFKFLDLRQIWYWYNSILTMSFFCFVLKQLFFEWFDRNIYQRFDPKWIHESPIPPNLDLIITICTPLGWTLSLKKFLETFLKLNPGFQAWVNFIKVENWAQSQFALCIVVFKGSRSSAKSTFFGKAKF